MQTNATSAPGRKLLDQVRDKIRFKHYSLSTENTYVSWIKQYILLAHRVIVWVKTGTLHA